MSEIAQIVNDMKLAASDVIGEDIGAISGFRERQLTAIAEQAKLIADLMATGEIDEEQRDRFLDGLKNATRNFTDTLMGLVLVSIEKIWNAVVGVIWGVISRISGINLTAP